MNQQEQIAAMAALMVDSRRAQEDIGEIIAAALHMAAEKLGDAAYLVQGRPGSWEADIVLRMAREGGSGDIERIKALSQFFIAMGETKRDGGDVLSQAMSQAVDDLGGLDQFSGGSQWHWDLVNMGRQYSIHWND